MWQHGSAPKFGSYAQISEIGHNDRLGHIKLGTSIVDRYCLKTEKEATN